MDTDQNTLTYSVGNRIWDPSLLSCKKSALALGNWQATKICTKNFATIDGENTKHLAHHKINDTLGW